MMTGIKTPLLVPLFCLLAALPLTGASPADAALRDVPTAPSRPGGEASGREFRPISRGEIFRAIQDDLAEREILGRERLRPEDLHIQFSAPDTQPDMGLEVMRIGFDPIRRETVFELWTSRAPEYLPFEVTTRRDPRNWGFSPPADWNVEDRQARAGKGEPATGQGLGGARTKLPLLARPGTPATLVMLGQNLRISITVVPLQPGTKGQCILVRDSTTGRVIRAEVVDDGLLQTSF